MLLGAVAAEDSRLYKPRVAPEGVAACVLTRRKSDKGCSGMPAFTIKNFPNKLLTALRREAVRSRRSVTQEVLRRLENSVAPSPRGKYRPAQDRLEIWSQIGGKWKSDLTVKEEIDRLYRARKRGRKITL